MMTTVDEALVQGHGTDLTQDPHMLSAKAPGATKRKKGLRARPPNTDVVTTGSSGDKTTQSVRKSKRRKSTAETKAFTDALAVEQPKLLPTLKAEDTAKGADAPVAKRRRSSRINSADRKSAVVKLKPKVPVTTKARKVTAVPVPVQAAAAPVLLPAASAAAVVHGSPTIVVSSFSDDDVKVFKPVPHKIREPKPLLDEEQARTICRNLRRREIDYGVSGQMKGAITHKMWAILVDWMIEVQVNFDLSQNSLFLGVNILSRYFRLAEVDRGDLQLAGAAALLIASKHEEINPREIADYVYICADTYRREDIIHSERRILRTLDYRLCAPLGSNFIMRYAAKCTRRELNLAMFVSELTLQDFRFSCLPPSLIAAGALNLVGLHYKRDVWTPAMAEELGYSESTVMQCSNLVNQHVTDEFEFEKNLTTCRDKYSDQEHSFVGKDRLSNFFATAEQHGNVPPSSELSYPGNRQNQGPDQPAPAKRATSPRGAKKKSPGN